MSPRFGSERLKTLLLGSKSICQVERAWLSYSVIMGEDVLAFLLGVIGV